MFNLFKKRKSIPSFEKLQGYHFRNYYFRRIASWRWLDSSRIVVIDPNSPRMITMDSWPQMIFIAADGQKTIVEYTMAVANEYSGRVPDLLDDTIIVELEKLVELKIVELTTIKQRPDALYDHARK